MRGVDRYTHHTRPIPEGGIPTNSYCKSIESAVLGRSIPVRFLVPEGESLPCLILLHGYNGNQDQWYEKSSIAQIAEKHRLAVVLPCCGNGYYEDTAEDMPRFLGEELVAYVKKTLPVSGARENMFIAGVSMGGFGAVLVGAKYHRVFGKIASFSGAFIIHDVAIGNPGVLGNADVSYFRSVFGDFASLEGSSRDPIAEAIRSAKGGAFPALFMLCGQEDILYGNNKKAAGELRKNGIPVTWYGGKGGHRWPFWNSMLPYVIKWLTNGSISELAAEE